MTVKYEETFGLVRKYTKIEYHTTFTINPPPPIPETKPTMIEIGINQKNRFLAQLRPFSIPMPITICNPLDIVGPRRK